MSSSENHLILENLTQVVENQVNKWSVECLSTCNSRFNRKDISVYERGCFKDCAFSKLENLNLNLINVKKE